MLLKTGQRGFALIELLVGLILLGLIGGVILHATVVLQRSVRAHLARLDAESALDTGVGFLGSELASLGRDAAGSDLLRQTPESLSYRGERATALACQVTANAVLVPKARYAGARLPQPGRDSLLLFVGPDPQLRRAGSWVAVPILAVQAGACGSNAAWNLVTVVDTTRVSLSALPLSIPTRLFEVMQARLYASSGATWLGVRSVSAGEAIQPLTGPFALARSGFILRDSIGSTTASLVATRQIEIGLSRPWSGWGAGTGPAPSESAGVTLTPGNLAP
ncbi:MAG: prepilin-type N-terminal cleavage/methylation domain-containing protein [Gemmatimonadales bacterium]